MSMNIKGKASHGLMVEFNNALGRAFEQEVQDRLEIVLADVADELADMMIAEAEELEQKHKEELDLVVGLSTISADLSKAVIESQVKELTELEATLEEAEARIDKLAADKRDLMERIHELEMENQRLAKHCQEVEVKSAYAEIEAMKAAEIAERNKAFKEFDDIIAKANEAAKADADIKFIMDFLFGDKEDK